MVCRRDDQWIGPKRRIRKPDIDLGVKVATCLGLWLGLGIDWSWGPQFASVNAVRESCCIGNWMKDSNSGWGRFVKVIPWALFDIRYLIAYCADLMCPGVGCVWCLARIDVIADRSGRVDCDSHNNEPTSDLYSCCRLRKSEDCLVESVLNSL